MSNYIIYLILHNLFEEKIFYSAKLFVVYSFTFINRDRWLQFVFIIFTDDPFEYNNIAEDNPEIVDKMMEKLMEYWVTMIPADVAKDVEEGNPVHFNGTFSPSFCDSEPY